MQITRDNYEAYFLDFAEGNLSADEVLVLEKFLEANPDLRVELEEFKNMSLTDADEQVFEGKDSLKKSEQDVPLTAQTYVNYFIAYHEGDLTASDAALVEKFVSENPSLKAEFDEFGKVKLKADASIAFVDKEEAQRKQDELPITLDNYTSAFVAHYEGDLSFDGEIQLQKFLEDNSQLQEEFLSFGQLNLLPDSGVVFTNKADLYQEEKKRGLILPLWRNLAVGAAAAAVLLFFAIRGFNGAEVEPDALYSHHTYGVDTAEEQLPIDTTPSVNMMINEPQLADQDNTSTEIDEPGSPSDRGHGQDSSNHYEAPITPMQNIAVVEDTTETDTVSIPLDAPQEYIAQDTTPEQNSPAIDDQIASNNPTEPVEYLKPGQVLKNKLKNKLGIKSDSDDDYDQNIAYGSGGTSEKKFSFRKGSSAEYESYELKLGGMVLSRKKRKKPVTNP